MKSRSRKLVLKIFLVLILLQTIFVEKKVEWVAQSYKGGYDS